MKKTLLLAGAMVAFAFTANAQSYYGGQRNYYNQPQYKAPSYSQPQYAPRYQQPQPYQQSNAPVVRPYIGLDFVYSMNDIDYAYSGLELDSYVEDDLGAGALSLGLKVNQNVGIEVFYQQSEEAEKTTGAVETQYEYKAYGLDLVGYLPVARAFDLLGTVGIGYYDLEMTGHDRTYIYDLSDDGLGFRVGVGGQINLTDNWGVRVMARYVNLDTDYVENMVDVSVGIRYTF